ncbi:hypothetical protein B1A99_12415 [Cohnella sp. CIP 111063]|nr:hypothetical protein B1A99_12415 [Cohnella sp. CIP 111063]PRX71850.1 hypothetical protein B0G52_10749 [Cohnella sp. SGD-V74]
MLNIWLVILPLSIILFLFLLLSAWKLKIKPEEKVLLLLFELSTAVLIPGILYMHFRDTYGPFDLKQGMDQFGTAILSCVFNIVVYCFYNLLVLYIKKWIPRLILLGILVAGITVSYLIASFAVGWTPDRSNEREFRMNESWMFYENRN